MNKLFDFKIEKVVGIWLKVALKMTQAIQGIDYKTKVVKKNGDNYDQVHSQNVVNTTHWFFVETVLTGIVNND